MLTRLLNGALGLAGESGEVADQVKKFAFQGHPFNADKIVNELGDVLWYIALLCRVLGVPLETVMQRNLDKLGIRYGDAFDTIRSQTRVDEQQEGTNNA
jgi:NTP pyrophosphatase (non-canonical NTP hydrolase)